MKNLFTTFLFVLALATTFTGQAQTIRRVNNSGITGTLIYADVALALTASAAGDIIQVEPSEIVYGSFTLNKNVTIVGPGYFLAADQNAGLQANPLPARVGGVDVQAGGASATMIGLTLTNDLYINASNVTIERCQFGRLIPAPGNALITGLTIKHCYFGAIVDFFSIPLSNLLITNCIITGAFGLPTSNNGGFFHNVVLSSISLSNFSVANNYFSQGIQGVGNTLNNNLSATASFPTTNGNRNNIAQSAVFVLTPGATAFDAWYQLKAGTNPARGSGQNGVDIGAFGGVDPYRLSGIPAIPTIYQQSETIVGNSLNATLSTRSNN